MGAITTGAAHYNRAPTVAHALRGDGGLGTDAELDGALMPSTGDVSHCLNAGGMGRQDYETETLVAHAFDARQSDDIAPTLRAMGHAGSHANGGGQMAVAFAQNTRDEVREMPVIGALAAQPGMKQTSYVRTAMQVRRLTPRECERLQGFPDDYTAIPWRAKPASECPDGPRYKALGNSMAVPVMRWIGERIKAAEVDPFK